MNENRPANSTVVVSPGVAIDAIGRLVHQVSLSIALLSNTVRYFYPW
jgi:hypothetical protein